MRISCDVVDYKTDPDRIADPDGIADPDRTGVPNVQGDTQDTGDGLNSLLQQTNGYYQHTAHPVPSAATRSVTHHHLLAF